MFIPLLLTIPIASAPAPIINHYPESKNDGIYILGKHQIIVGEKSPYEILGFSIIETQDNLTFSIKSNLPLAGLPEPRANKKHIGYGDLILYYKNTKIGIKFATQNKGIYSNITVVNDAANHFGSKTPQNYIDRVKSSSSHDFNGILPPEWVTHMGTGTLLSREVNVTQIQEGQSYLIQITINKKNLPSGSFTAYLPTECINDYVLGKYTLASASKTNDAEISDPEVANNLSLFPKQNGLFSTPTVDPIVDPKLAAASAVAFAGLPTLLSSPADAIADSSIASDNEQNNSDNKQNNVTDPVDPLDPITPSDPTDPLDPIIPIAPIDPIDPVDPIDPIDPVDPTSVPEPGGLVGVGLALLLGGGLSKVISRHENPSRPQ